uniref:Uncharacterized protein n=1 Tax=Arundo donax TaxID=35708 RepID=A0A0A8ZHG2_ARUDO
MCTFLTLPNQMVIKMMN